MGHPVLVLSIVVMYILMIYVCWNAGSCQHFNVRRTAFSFFWFRILQNLFSFFYLYDSK